MAPTLDHRFYSAIPYPSISPAGAASPVHAHDAVASSPVGAGVPSPMRTPLANASKRESTASSPSLRSKEGVLKNTGPPPPFNIASASSNSNVKVVVRVRGFLPRERNSKCLISMDPSTETTTLIPHAHLSERSHPFSKQADSKTFTFDKSFWSFDETDEHYASQNDIYDSLGEEFLDHNFEGYHTCILAYGQTGSGKSYTMMGTPEQPGLIPRTCEDLFLRIKCQASPNVTYNVRVSYFEVYNEHVRDLLVPRTDPPYYLRIRESPTEGPYVKDLTEAPVRNYAEILRYIQSGDASRSVASTKMNDTSSRSHAVFTIMLKQMRHDLETDETTERTARIRLVDLAGSERAKATESTGQRLREGSNINKSLTTLGRVIAALAGPKPHGSKTNSRKIKDSAPYRDSILTWLLKDSLGGNSKTAMIACISPGDYDETLSTLRYAEQAKHIRTRAVVNQDQVSAAQRDAQIAEMAETIRELQLNVNQQTVAQKDIEKQSQQLDEYQQQVSRMQQLMEETKLIAESKIRQLTTQNEALRLHLKLALDSLKSPIMTIDVNKNDDGHDTTIREPRSDDYSREPSLSAPSKRTTSGSSRSSYFTATPDSHVSAMARRKLADTTRFGNENMQDVQGEMEALLKDITFFKHKIMDDQGRFGSRDKAKRSPRSRERAMAEMKEK